MAPCEHPPSVAAPDLTSTSLDRVWPESACAMPLTGLPRIAIAMPMADFPATADLFRTVFGMHVNRGNGWFGGRIGLTPPVRRGVLWCALRKRRTPGAWRLAVDGD